MDYVLDTNILVHFVRSDLHIRQMTTQIDLFSSENNAFISIVSVGELRSLAFQFGWGEEKIKRMSYFLHALNPFPIDSEEIAKAYADLDAYSQCIHPHYTTPVKMTARNMGKNDLWIAATTLLFNATLITTDSDFDHFPSQFFNVEKVEFSVI